MNMHDDGASSAVYQNIDMHDDGASSAVNQNMDMHDSGTPSAATCDIRIADAFAHGKAFIPFITAGDPDIRTTRRIVIAMVQAGADLVEIGIPFSDPTAEGPVIQGANLRALSGGMDTEKAFELVETLRKVDGIRVPMVYMTYANVVFSYPGGIEAFCERAANVGVQGLILPDVPFEEHEEFAAPARTRGLSLVSMIAPTSHDRIRAIAKGAEGFVYCVSSLGVTGERTTITGDIAGMVDTVRSVTDVPVAVGFGISTPEQAAQMAARSDGAIVGSAIVRMVGTKGADSVDEVRSYVHAMKEAVARA